MKRLAKKNKRAMTAIYAKIDWSKATMLFQKPLPGNHISHEFPPVKQFLQILAAAGGIGLIFAFPGAALAIGTLFLGKKSYPRWQTKQLINQLAKQKYVSVKENSDGTVMVKITKQGITRALTYRLETMQLEKSKKWDGKWRVVTFDIPDKYKRIRDVFRMRLKQLGLFPLQESVYISPYKCFNEIEFLRELYGVALTIKYLLVEKIEDDSFLKTHFSLS